jgi:alkylated DNA repair dioxygenase AlkB
VELLKNILPFDGEVYLYPALFTAAERESLYTQLKNGVPWKQEPIVIAGRSIMQPRLTAWYGDAGKPYSYSGITMHPYPWSDALLHIRQRIEAVAAHTFTSALLNFYRDGNDSVGWHRDNEKELGKDPLIGSVSFGVPRTFYFRHAKEKRATEKIVLTSGSFLLMKGTTQHHWLHSIKKEPRITEGRINITFRSIVV